MMVAATIPDALTFAICAVIVLGGAIGVIVSRNTVHSALMLVATLFGVAVLFLEQDADFLAAVQVIVYAGAIVVLFLFVIMLLGVDRREAIEQEPLRGQRPLAFLLGALTLAGVLLLGFGAHWSTGAPSVAGKLLGHTSEVKKLGASVFTTYLLAFEITAALLLIAVVAAVWLARGTSIERKEEPKEPTVASRQELPSPNGNQALPPSAGDVAGDGEESSQEAGKEAEVQA
jgi:NADH-quinone oxidoreductase subunit J